MDFSAAIPTFVITLREGVEAALVVGIVLACLKKSRQSQLNPWVYAGIGVGIALSALVGVLFSQLLVWLGTVNPQYTPVLEPLLEGSFGVVAIAMLSWMLVWMTRQARFLKAQVEGSITSALKQGNAAGWGVFSLVLIAVLREGFEAVLFIAAKFQQGLVPTIGVLAGMGVAAGIGALMFRWGVRVNIRQFFLVMGVLLLLIVAGLVVTSLGHFDAAIDALSKIDRRSESLCFFHERFVKNPSCLLGSRVWNLGQVLPDDKFPGVLLSAMFGYTQNLFLVQAVGYVGFLVTIGFVYFRSMGGRVAFKANPAAKVTSNSRQDA